MTQSNPYNAYVEDAILNSNPVGLVVALYEGAIDSCASARHCLASHDIPGRTRAINKTFGIIAELLRALNDEKGGEISHNLRRLYIYMQRRLSEAHRQQDAAPLKEVESLLATMLEGWHAAKVRLEPVAASAPTPAPPSRHFQAAAEEQYGHTPGTLYGSYFLDAGDFPANSAFSY